jgi:recombinational DNA repair protein RecR
VVEDIRDVMAMENTGQFRGIYHVLGGKISPIDGLVPVNLKITSLVNKVKKGSVKKLFLLKFNDGRGYDQLFSFTSKLQKEYIVPPSKRNSGGR